MRPVHPDPVHPEQRRGGKFLVLATCLLVAACPSNSPDNPDGGRDGGGGAGGDGGSDAGFSFDAGPPDDQCGLNVGTCDAGASCLIQALPDGGRGKRCLEGICDVVRQDCSGALKCDYRDGGRTCVADGNLAEGADCLGNGFACVKGTVCTNLNAPDGGTVSRCTKFCEANADCTSPQQCLLVLVLSDSTERPMVCADPPPTCDLLTQTCMSTTDGCYPNGGTGQCFRAGMTAPESPCVFSNDCVRGSTCINTAGGATCRTLCAHPTGTPGCDGGTCVRLAGATGVGVCL